MPVLTLTASSLGFLFGTLSALVGNNEEEYLFLLRVLREPRKVSKRLRKLYCRHQKNQTIELSELNFLSTQSLLTSSAKSTRPSECGSVRVSYDLESLPSLCTSDTDSDAETTLASPGGHQEPRFLLFWDQQGLPEAAP